MYLARKLSIICAISLIAVMMYSTPNAVYAASPAGGVSGVIPKNSIHAAISTPPNINNLRWNEFAAASSVFTEGCTVLCVPSSGANSNYASDPLWNFDVPTNAHATLTVTDAFNTGNTFTVSDFGSTILTTSGADPVDNTTPSITGMSDPETALTSLGPHWSHGTVDLAAGSHSINILSPEAPLEPTNKLPDAGYFKIDIACDTGYHNTAALPDVLCEKDVTVVGGMGIPIDSTALLLAGVQGSALWMIPALVIAGAGITIFKLKKKNQGETC